MNKQVKTFLRDRAAVMAAVVLLSLVLISLFAPWLSPHDPNNTSLRNMMQAPSQLHPLGTDDLGRDVLSRMMFAGRVSLGLAFSVTALALILGSVIGGLAGLLGGRVDAVISAVVDTFLAVPPLALAMVASAFLSLNLTTLTIVLALVSWPGIARIARGQVLTLRERTYVEAARASGASTVRLLRRHLLPNAVAPLVVAGTLLVATVILVESALSFLGFGLAPPTASWGGMLNEAQPWFQEAPWLAVFPGLAITLAVAASNLVGDALRAAIAGGTLRRDTPT